MRLGHFLRLGSSVILAVASIANAQSQIIDREPPVVIPGSETPEGKEVAKELDSIIIHRVNFEKLDIDGALSFLNELIKRQTPAGRKPLFLRLAASLSDDKVKPFIRRDVSITLEDCPLGDVLLYICNQTNLAVEIIPNREVQLYSAEFDKARQDTVKAIANFKIDHVDFKQTGIEAFVAALDEKCKQANLGQISLTVIYRPRPDDPPLSKIRHKTITMTLHDAPLLDILQDAMTQTDFEFTIEPNTVVIRPGRSDD